MQPLGEVGEGGGITGERIMAWSQKLLTEARESSADWARCTSLTTGPTVSDTRPDDTALMVLSCTSTVFLTEERLRLTLRAVLLTAVSRVETAVAGTAATLAATEEMEAARLTLAVDCGGERE